MVGRTQWTGKLHVTMNAYTGAHLRPVALELNHKRAAQPAVIPFQGYACNISDKQHVVALLGRQAWLGPIHEDKRRSNKVCLALYTLLQAKLA